MKRVSAAFLFSVFAITGCAQKSDLPGNADGNTLLWKISGKGLEKPSYLYGTMHMICAEDAGLSANMKTAIKDCDEVYFEVDMNNMIDMFLAVSKMKMKGDTTLHDLLSPADYEKVKKYFESKSTMLPFSMLETYKPILAASTLEESGLLCDNTVMMEQVIMEEANQYKKKTKGLETMAYQAGVLDSIPYKLQAQQLVNYVDSAVKNGEGGDSMKEMFDAYKDQNLKKMEEMMIETDAGMAGFTEILLYHRNSNWVTKLKDLLPRKSLVIAVGAGHLPGDKGVISLLRKAGYTVTPIENKTRATKTI